MPKAKAKTTKKKATKPTASSEFGWHHFEAEGELAVDVAQTKKDLVITAAIAGVDPDDLSITIDHDVLTIRGHRTKKKKFKDEDYFYEECYWGGFSRSIILPVEVQKDKTKASVKNGILSVTIAKAKLASAIPIEIIDD